MVVGFLIVLFKLSDSRLFAQTFSGIELRRLSIIRLRKDTI